MRHMRVKARKRSGYVCRVAQVKPLLFIPSEGVHTKTSLQYRTLLEQL